MKELTLIFIIVILAFLCIGLTVAVIYMGRWINKAQKKIDDLSLIIHFATDNFLINERKKQKDRSNGASRAGDLS